MQSRLSLKCLTMAASAALIAAGAAGPAAAGGRGHGDGHGGHGYSGYYGDAWRYDGDRGYWRGGNGHSGHYRYDRHRGGLSGAEAGFIAAGIVGAAILIDSASDRGRDRYGDDRNDRSRERYEDRSEDRYGRGDFYYRRDDRRLSDRDWNDFSDDELGRRLDGAPIAVARSGYNYGAAYNDCKAEARDAARREGLTVGLPAKPDRIEQIESGSAVRFVTQFQLDEGRGAAGRQTMVCEADADGVRFLELV